MNSLALLIIALCVFALAYRYYAAFIAAKVLVLDTNLRTPAHVLHDGKDYVPMNNIVNVYLPKGDLTNTILSIAVLALVGIVMIDSLRQWIGLIRTPGSEN